MSKMNKIMALLACAAAALPMGVRAEGEDAVSASLDVPVLSAYVWRGQVIVDDPVVQPTFTVAKSGFSINWWGNYNLDDNATGDEFEFSEHDITLSYSGITCPLTGAGVTVGIVNYDFPNVGLVDAEGNLSLVNDTAEAFLIYSLADVLLSPTVSVYYDVKEADGFYGSVGVSHSVEVADKISLGLAASLGAADKDWSTYYFGEDASGLTDYSVSATLPVALTDSVTLTPGVQYTGLLDDASDIVDDTGLYFGDTEKVIGSVKLSYVF
jgi:hypothetical protein